MGRNYSGSREFTVTLESGKKVTAEMYISIIHDSNYGADADGNRGMPVDFIDELFPEHEIDTDDEGQPLSSEEKEEALVKLEEAAQDADWSNDV